jgi:hypothetical protein
VILSDTESKPPLLHHRLIATRLTKVPKPVKGQKSAKPKRDVSGPAVLYYRKITGAAKPTAAVTEEVR